MSVFLHLLSDPVTEHSSQWEQKRSKNKQRDECSDAKLNF